MYSYIWCQGENILHSAEHMSAVSASILSAKSVSLPIIAITSALINSLVLMSNLYLHIFSTIGIVLATLYAKSSKLDNLSLRPLSTNAAIARV